MAIDGVEDSARELLSALADGEVDSAGVAPSCGAWARSDRLRADWHAWHLIGDVLRSDDLAADPRRDRHFCAAVRMRLAAEPVVLAPAPVAPSAILARGSRRGPWAAAGAVAAGLVLVVGTFVVVRPVDAPLPPRLAIADGPPTVARSSVTPAAPAVEPVAIVADNKIIRDAQLDRYLEAHKQFAGTSALGVPSAFLRSATVDSASR